MLAWEDSTSIDCARLMRGAASSANADRPCCAMTAVFSVSKWLSMPISTVPTAPIPPGAPTAPLRRLGRIGVMNVEPVVDRGNRPAKSVVDEEFAITATVFREGHEAVGATVVLTDPDGIEHSRPMVRTVAGLVPDVWLEDEPGFDSADAVRAAYVDHLLRRVAARGTWQP